jgi:2'-hydroxyisoflavone reductase
MWKRREFLARAIVAGAVFASGRSLAGAHAIHLTPRRAVEQRAAKSLRILILGGTGNIGPYHVRAALARGHRVAVFSRGKTHAELPADVERLIGDRNGDLKAIRDRDWDGVIDIATTGPGWVRSLSQIMGQRVGHYTFISTVSVYDQPGRNAVTTEDSPLLVYSGSADPYTVSDRGGSDFGALKALGEKEAEKQFRDRTLILRPGYIGGPGDTTRALAYWALRAGKGGAMLAGGDAATPVQYIDVRDLAEWVIRMVEKRATGIYNAVGPAEPVNLGQIVEAARDLAQARSSVTWVPSSWLHAQPDHETWSTLLFWSEGVGPIMRMSNQRALAAGLTTRPVSVTLADTLTWMKQLPANEQTSLIVGHKKQPDGNWTEVTMTWPAYLERERQTLARWRQVQ